MGRRTKAVLFWALMALSAVALARSGWKDWRDSLGIGAFVVPLVTFTFWLQNRFTGARRRAVTTMIYSGLSAVVSALAGAWELILLGHGFGDHGHVVRAVVAGAVFVVCSSVFVWSLMRLLRPDSKLPT